MAFSSSPLASVNARLQSIKGRPVFSRNARTAAALISPMSRSPQGCAVCVVNSGMTTRPLRWRPLPASHSPHRRRCWLAGFGFVSRFLFRLDRRIGPARNDGVRQHLQHELNRANAVVVAGNRQIHIVRIAIGIDQGDRRQPQPARFTDRVLLFAGIHHHETLRHPIHRPQAVEVAIHLAILASQGRLHFLGVFSPACRWHAGLRVPPDDPAGCESSGNWSTLHPTSARPQTACRTAGTPVPRPPPLDAWSPRTESDSRRWQLDSGTSALATSPRNGFANVNDVNLVLAGIDIRCHLGIPETGTMPKMHSRTDQFLDQRFRHRLAPDVRGT